MYVMRRLLEERRRLGQEHINAERRLRDARLRGRDDSTTCELQELVEQLQASMEYVQENIEDVQQNIMQLDNTKVSVFMTL